MSEKYHKPKRKLALILMLSALVVVSAFQTAKAATISSATLDKDKYLAGQTGYISTTLYNDKNSDIRVTELSATIDYYYADGTVYVQKFFTSKLLPDEILEGQTKNYQIPISLPTNIAPGYMNLMVEATTELWVNQTQRWISSERATDQVKLYVESPYKQSYEDAQAHLQDSQQQIHEQETANQNLSATAIGLGIATLAFAGIAAFLIFVLMRRPKPSHNQLNN